MSVRGEKSSSNRRTATGWRVLDGLHVVARCAAEEEDVHRAREELGCGSSVSRPG